MTDKSEFITDIIVTAPKCHNAFREVNWGYPLDDGEAYIRLPKEAPFNPMASTNRNGNGPRSHKTVGEGLPVIEADRLSFYVQDIPATIAYREQLILGGSDIFIHKGRQFRPARFGEGYDLIVYPNDFVFEDFDDDQDDVQNSLVLRYYRLREIQEPEDKVRIREAVNGLAEAILQAVNKPAEWTINSTNQG